MRKVKIKYNPYKLDTEVLIDGKPVRTNSELNVNEKRLQEWIEELPRILVEECNTNKFSIEFYGTLMDYEDLFMVSKESQKDDIFIECKHIPASETKDKEKKIRELFNDLQKGPFEEFKQPDLKEAFEQAFSSEFEVNVIATMSAGKSTLINALLNKKLMPSKQEACTATITKIKDRDSNDTAKMDSFEGIAVDKNGNVIESDIEITYEKMNQLNSNPLVSTISLQGNLPFVLAEDVALVLVDTPGPNNSRDIEHKEATYRMLSKSSKTLVLYILNATQLAVNDDNDLLNYVAESMKVGGKQSKDRFIFVVNKIDTFRKGEDSVPDSINKVKHYLEDKGIENPNIFPAAALPALDIRTILLSEDDVDEDDVDEAKHCAKKMIKNPELHLEEYAPLSKSKKEEIAAELALAKNKQNVNSEALIHTGIISIETAIRLYVEKYAKTAKIKNIVDTFSKKLESAKSFENTKKEISENQDKQEVVMQQINAIKSKLNDVEDAKTFKVKIAEINYDGEISSAAMKVINETQKKISGEIEKMELNSKMSKSEVESIRDTLVKLTEDLQAQVKVKLEEIISNNLVKNASDLLIQYKNKISNLTEEMMYEGIIIDSFSLMEGEITNVDALIADSAKTEKVVVGQEWVENTEKKWFKPWTWLESKGWYEAVYSNEEYFDGDLIIQKFLTSIEFQLFANYDNAIKYGADQGKKIKEYFTNEFLKLDEVLTNKLNELEKCTLNNKNIEKTIKDIQKKLDWLNEIQIRIQTILEI